MIAEAGTPVHFLLQVLGDPAAIDSLVKILGNDGAWLVNRTYAAIALGGIVDHDFTFAAEAHDPAEEAPVIEHDRLVLVVFRDGLVWFENGFNDVFRCRCGTRGREIRPDSRS